jgi:hypothetical protein
MAAGSLSLRAPSQRVPHFDATQSMLREKRLPVIKSELSRLQRALRSLESSPGEAFSLA